MFFPGEIAALITAFCWTVTAMSFESAGRKIGSLAVNWIRLVLALILLCAFNYIYRNQALPFDAAAHQWIWLSLSGIIGFTLGDLALFRAFILIGSRISMLLMSLVPPFTALFGYAMMGEVLTIPDWIGMTLTVSGVAIVILERKQNENGDLESLPKIGILLGLIAALGQAGGLALSKFGMQNYDPFAATQIRVIAGIIGFSVLYSITGQWHRVADGLKNSSAMKRVSIGAFFGPFLGVSFSLIAVQSAKTGVAATIMSITPILIIAPAAILFKEKISPRSIAGAVIAISGVAVLFIF